MTKRKSIEFVAMIVLTFGLAYSLAHIVLFYDHS